MKIPTISEIPGFIDELAPLVKAYLITRAAAEAMRIRVNEIGTEMLELYPLRDNDTGELITDVRNDWFAYPGEAWDRWRSACVEEQEKQGLRSHFLESGHCPALVLESEQTNVENLLISVSGAPFGVTNHKLLCSGQGLKRRQEWIDLVCRLVVNSPEFRAPASDTMAGLVEGKS